MAKKDVAEFICRPFCSFYREGAKEELICNGARMLESLMEKGDLSTGALTEVEAGTPLSPDDHALLEEIVCRPCAFVADDCDFRSQAPPPGAKPCGGYILLTLLAGKCAVCMEKLKGVEVE